MPDPRRCRIEIVTNAPGILDRETTGLAEVIQAARAKVTIDGAATSHVVVRAATPPFLLESADESIRRLFPDDVVSLVHADVPGMATISCSASGERERFGAAASVASVKRAWAGDRSRAITITFETDGRAFRLNPVSRDGAWSVEMPTR